MNINGKEMTPAELMKLALEPKTFKHLRIDMDSLQIFINIGKFENEYPVDLDRCRNEHEILDWILHMNEKRWMDGERMKELIDAIDTAFVLHFRHGVRELRGRRADWDEKKFVEVK